MTVLTNDTGVAEQMYLEVGARAFRCLCAENDGFKYIEGVSHLFYLTDDSDDWSDILWMFYDDDPYNYQPRFRRVA